MKKIKRMITVVLTLCIMMTVLSTGKGSTAEAATYWVRDSHGCRLNQNGTYVKNKWMYVNGLKYHFDSKGYRQTGWQCIGGKQYYFNTNGVMLTGWRTISRKRYFFNSDGTYNVSITKYGKKELDKTFGVKKYTGWFGYDAAYVNSPYKRGNDDLYVTRGGVFSGDFTDNYGYGCHYAGQFSALKLVGGTYKAENNNNLLFQAKLIKYAQTTSNGLYYLTKGRYVKASAHPVFRQGKTYFFKVVNVPGDPREGYGGGTWVEILDSKKRSTGYVCAAGCF